MAPNYRRDNPYQALLSGALARQATAVAFPRGYRRGLPLWRAVRGQDAPPAVLHLHWLAPYLRGRTLAGFGLYGLKLLADLALVRRAGVAIVWTIHNRLGHEARFPRCELWLRRRVAALAACCIVHSESAKALVARDLRIDPAKLRVIPHGHYRGAYPAALGRRAARAALGLPPDGLVYLYFGTIRPYKGLETLLEVWSDTPELHTAATLLLAGAPLNETYGHRIRALAAQARGVVAHLERVPDGRVAHYFSAADLVVLPFEHALTSGSLLLAMSYNKPVIAPRLPTVVETLGEAGNLLYDPAARSGASETPSDHTGLREALLEGARRRAEDRAGGPPNTGAPRCNPPEWSDVAELTAQAYLDATARPQATPKPSKPRESTSQPGTLPAEAAVATNNHPWREPPGLPRCDSSLRKANPHPTAPSAKAAIQTTPLT